LDSRRTPRALHLHKLEVLEVLKNSADAYVAFDLLGELADFADSQSDILLLLDYVGNHRDPIVRHEASAQLAELWRKRPRLFQGISQQVISVLLKAASEDESPLARHEAIEALGFIGDASVIQSLRNLQEREKNEDVNHTARIALDIIEFCQASHVGLEDVSQAIVKADRRRRESET
jgi:HEAT repeat protein